MPASASHRRRLSFPTARKPLEGPSFPHFKIRNPFPKWEYLHQAVLRSLPGHVAVLDQHGVIISVNAAWQRTATRALSPALLNSIKGDNYLEACRKVSVDRVETVPGYIAGVKAVLSGSQNLFSFEYLSHSPEGQQWFLVEAIPLLRPEGGAVISHLNIMERKRAQLAIDQVRTELAHVQRASTMGELTSSLAHELNQPMTAILSNAQAALGFLKSNPPQMGPLKQILMDIISDDKRAGDMIRRVRTLLKKKEVEHKALQLNDVISEVHHIVNSDAIFRRTKISLKLTPDLPRVLGDMIQIQQVLLNLILNGFDAMTTVPPEQRFLRIETWQSEPGTVRVSVKDSGLGFGKKQLARIFEPYYSTKSEGLGLGLSIARSIVEAHGGQIWAEANNDGGATFHVSLPVSAT